MHSKLLAYHTGKHTEAYTWRLGTLSARHVFSDDAAGVAEFAAYLRKHAKLPLYFLVDIIEEDFRLDTIPHLFGRSRHALINRKLGQAFRTETHRHTALQGRETEGRRDDRLLLSALTNSEALKPWIDTILACKIALAGIYSVPLLSQAIIRELGLADIPHLLFITRQSDGGLRQSYLQNGHLKLSRLVYLDDNGQETLTQSVNEESTKIQQYLNNQRLLPRDQLLEIHLLCHDSECRDLLDGCESTPTRQFVLHEQQEAGAALKLPSQPGAGVTPLFLQFLARRRVKNHYASSRETRFWQLNRILLAMRSGSIALIAFGALSATYNIADGMNHAAQTGQILQQLEQVKTEERAVRSAFPPLPATPDILKSSVELAEQLTAHPRTPEILMSAISRVMDDLPQIQVQRFKWVQTANPGLDISPKSASPLPAVDSATPNTGSGILEMALMEGEVVPFNNYRDALTTIESLSARLNTVPGLKVTPLSLPIETAPQAQLKGNLDESAQPPAAKFSLKLVYQWPGS